MALELDTRQRAMLQEMGVHVWLPESGVVTLQQAEPGDTEQSARTASLRAQSASSTPARTPITGNILAATLDWPELADAVRNCQACSLCAARSKASIAPLSDAVSCDWMVVGDPPDEDEDHTGAPFAGQDGVLLANMLRALRLERFNPVPGTAISTAPDAAQRTYVTHVLKCRPVHGAVPKPAELLQCAAYLQQEIALVRPKVILAMGRFANQVLLSEPPALASLPLGKLRGTVHRYQGVPVVVTYHPKVLMRNGVDKAKAWADLCLAASTLDAPAA